MYYENYYWGMNIIWWVLWFFLMIWIFALPYEIPYQRHKKESAFDILKKQFANGTITESEYLTKKKALEIEFQKTTLNIVK